MSTFTYTPSYSAEVTVSPRVRNAQFGDGYSQRTADGINNQPRAWSLRFTGKASRIDDIDDFLAAHGGLTSFDWTPPTGVAGKWLASEWKRSLAGYNNEVITVTFNEVFGE